MDEVGLKSFTISIWPTHIKLRFDCINFFTAGKFVSDMPFTELVHKNTRTDGRVLKQKILYTLEFNKTRKLFLYLQILYACNWFSFVVLHSYKCCIIIQFDYKPEGNSLKRFSNTISRNNRYSSFNGKFHLVQNIDSFSCLLVCKSCGNWKQTYPKWLKQTN